MTPKAKKWLEISAAIFGWAFLLFLIGAIFLGGLWGSAFAWVAAVFLVIANVVIMPWVLFRVMRGAVTGVYHEFEKNDS